jgi:outer membrane protein OmpA-like peptidoglycan-associated protein
MMLGFPATNKGILRFAAAFAVAMSASACSSLPSMPDVPDWVDPTTWFGDDSSSATDDSGQAPDLANLPDKPTGSSSADQQQVAESLAADRSNAKYSSDALRGGTESAAPPPPDVAPVAPTSAALPSVESKPAAAPVEQPRTAQVDQSIAQAPTGPAMPGTLPSPGLATRVASIAAPVQTASLPEPAPAVAMPPPGAQPAVPPTPAVPQLVGSIAPSDAALGFKPSHAVALDPSVSQFVAPPVLQHYEQTAANAGLPYSSPVVAVASTKRTKLRKPHDAEGVGGPETMTGAVVANLEAVQPNTTSTPSVYASPQGLPATAVVFFRGDSVNLNAEARAQVRAAAEQFKAGGGQGFVRVVGHSSSRTANMSVERHLEVIFRKSQDRASAVAQELIHDGVPASKVLVEAVGDSQPVYYESMPKGEDGNRRTEIFLQG